MSTKTVETVTTEVETQCTDQQPADKCAPAACGWDGETIALWVVAFIFILLWTIAVWWGVSSWCNNNRGKKGKKGCDNDDDCDRGNNSFGFVGGFLIWLIILIIFLGVVWMFKWAGLVVFIIIIILLGAVVCAACTGNGRGKGKKSKSKSDSETHS